MPSGNQLAHPRRRLPLIDRVAALAKDDNLGDVAANRDSLPTLGFSERIILGRSAARTLLR